MAIVKNGEVKQIQGTDGQTVDIYNGDWEALKKITTKWNIKDEAAALRFALAILSLAQPGGLSINGEIITPAESLLKAKNGNEE